MGLAKINRIHRGKVPLQLRSVALFEAAKAVLILLLGCGAFDLIHKNVDAVAEQIALMLRSNADGKLSHVFVKLATHVSDHTLWLVAVGALFDGTIRSIAAYGLWRGRGWAQWFELLSTLLYLPAELYLLLRHPDWLKAGLLVANVVIVLVMISFCMNAVWLQRRSRPTEPKQQDAIGKPSPADENALLTNLRDDA